MLFAEDNSIPPISTPIAIIVNSGFKLPSISLLVLVKKTAPRVPSTIINFIAEENGSMIRLFVKIEIGDFPSEKTEKTKTETSPRYEVKKKKLRSFTSSL